MRSGLMRDLRQMMPTLSQPQYLHPVVNLYAVPDIVVAYWVGAPSCWMKWVPYWSGQVTVLSSFSLPAFVLQAVLATRLFVGRAGEFGGC
jgi:hypothetical protein